MRKRGTLVGGALLAVAGTWGAEGCMPDVVEVGRGTAGAGATAGAAAGGGAGGKLDDSGGAGGGARAGGSGSGAGGTSGNGAGGFAGRTTAGRGGGSTGGHGGAGRNTGGNGATAGSEIMPGGSGGDAGSPPFTFDPSCDCHAVADNGFYCSLGLGPFSEPPSPPATCDNDLDFVHLETCNSTSIYRWSEGGENAYELAATNGAVVYYLAQGYVGSLCGISDPNYDIGTVELGTPTTVQCGNECSVCEGASGLDPTPSLGACEPCSDPSFPGGTNQESLQDFCSFHYCPANLAEARAKVASECPTTPVVDQFDSTVTSGCGVIRVTSNRELSAEDYYFDSVSQTLVAADFHGDVPGGQCHTAGYAGGTIPAACTDADICTLCAYPSGAAGAGSAGASGATPPPAPCPSP